MCCGKELRCKCLWHESCVHSYKDYVIRRICVIYLFSIFVRVREPGDGQLSILSVFQSSECVEPAEDVRHVLVPLRGGPAALAALGQARGHLEARPVLQERVLGPLGARGRAAGVGAPAAPRAPAPAPRAASSDRHDTANAVPATHTLYTRNYYCSTHFHKKDRNNIY